MSASFCQPSPKPHFLHEEMCLLAGPHCKLEEVTLRKEGCNKNQTHGKRHPKPIQEPEHPNPTKREGRSLPFHKYLFRAIHQISASTAFSPKGVGGELSTFPHAPARTKIHHYSCSLIQSPTLGQGPSHFLLATYSRIPRT